jgi:hypothetical protein
MTTSPRDSIVEVLEVAQRHDSRNIDSTMVDTWLKAARLARWPSTDLVKAAVDYHYAHQTERIMPGHVTQLLRSTRSGPASVSELRANPHRGLSGLDKGSTAEHRARLRAQIAAELDERRGGPSRVKARQPWHNGPVRSDEDQPALEASPVDGRRAMLQVVRGGRAEGPSAAFGGRPG